MTNLTFLLMLLAFAVGYVFRIAHEVADRDRARHEEYEARRRRVFRHREGEVT